jgi:hypothetical protein
MTWTQLKKYKEPTHVITIIGANNQMVTSPKDIDDRLNLDKPKKLIKDK